MARKKVKKKAAKRKTAKKRTARTKTAKKRTAAKRKAAKKETAKKKTAKGQKRATPELTETPAGKKSIKPFEVCNHFGVHLREIFEKEYSQNREARLGEVFEYLLRDLHGAWSIVKLYGKETPLEKLRSEGNPFHYDL